MVVRLLSQDIAIVEVEANSEKETWKEAYNTYRKKFAVELYDAKVRCMFGITQKQLEEFRKERDE